MKEIITIQVSKFLANDLVEKIAQKQWNSSAPKCVNRSRQSIFDELTEGNGCFGVVALTPDRDVAGRLHCIQNEDNPKLWYYGDLFVVPEYRRMGIASRMIRAALWHLSEMGAVRLRCYVAPENAASRSLQLSMGFSEQPFQEFNDLSNDGEIMYEAEVPSGLSVISATEDEAYFVRKLFVQNREALHTDNISLAEWRELLSARDSCERHFLVCKGAMPVGYMKAGKSGSLPARIDNPGSLPAQINGLGHGGEARISMLFVAKAFQRQGIGSFAVRNAEEYARREGYTVLAAQADRDNIPVRNFLLKCGFQISGQEPETIFRKAL